MLPKVSPVLLLQFLTACGQRHWPTLNDRDKIYRGI